MSANAGQHTLGVPVDVSHPGNLLALLTVVLLVNAYNIDPMLPASAMEAGLLQGIFAIWCDRHPPVVDGNESERIRVSPYV